MKYLLSMIFCSVLHLSAYAETEVEHTPSSLVGIIDWAKDQSAEAMESFISSIEDGYRSFITLSSEKEREKIKENAELYLLALYQPEKNSAYFTKENQEDYKIYQSYLKYKALESLSERAASSIEERIEYALQYDQGSLFSATGVKIADISEEIFSIPYSRVLAKSTSNYSELLIRSAADLAIAQQAAYYYFVLKKAVPFAEIYEKILEGFNSAEITRKQSFERLQKEKNSENQDIETRPS